MLGNYPISAVLPVMDLAKAKQFYGGTLGLKQVEEQEGGVLFEAGQGSKVMLYQRPVPTKAEHTVAGFDVNELEKVMEGLRAKGVTFEEYDIPEMGLKTKNGVAEMGNSKNAWFKDPDGNIIALSQKV